MWDVQDKNGQLRIVSRVLIYVPGNEPNDIIASTEVWKWQATNWQMTGKYDTPRKDINEDGTLKQIPD